jgi:hypothetical protein
MKNQLIQSSELANVGKRRILVVANVTVDGAALRELLGPQSDGQQPVHVLVIAPALNSRLRHWLSDEDEARRSAGRRLALSLERLRAVGIEAEGQIGDPNPLQAIADALYEFGAQEIVIPTEREGRAHWLTRDLVGRARRRFAQPVVQVATEQNTNAALLPQSARRRLPSRSAKGAVARRAQEAST